MSAKIPIYKPYLHRYKTSAIDAVNSEWISNHGKYVTLATDKLKEILNSKGTNVILMANGTVATHCLFLSLKFLYPQIKKIYLPNNCYVAVYNCALMVYDMSQLEIMKVDEKTWNMSCNEEYLSTLEKDSCILICHNVGGIINVDKIKQLRPDIILLEDNCEGVFGKYNNVYTGTSQNVLCSSMSFYGNKTVTSGEGGAFLTNNSEVYNYVKAIYTQGQSNVRYVHNILAYNYRMTNVEAAFLYDQFNDIEHILSLKENVFSNYVKELQPLILLNKVNIQSVDENCQRANWMFSIRIMNNEKTIDETSDFFNKYGIEIRPFFYPYNKHEHLKDITMIHDRSINEVLNKEIIMLPSYPTLSLEEQKYIVSILTIFLS
jgi:perosamine synthetase